MIDELDLQRVRTSSIEINNKITKPRCAILLLTLGCNLRCKICYHWQNKEEGINRPSIKEWKHFIASFAEVIERPFTVVFGGGEPLLFVQELLGLINFCAQSGYNTSLATSGYLITEELAKRLVDSGLDYVALTLYSLNEETHDFLRGTPGAYQRTMRAIEYLDKSRGDLEIAIDTILMGPNMDEVVPLAQWAIADNRLRSIFFQAIVQPFHTSLIENWYKSNAYSFLWPKDVGKIHSIIEELIELKRTLRTQGRDKINNPFSQLKVFKEYFEAPEKFIKKLNCNVLRSGTFGIGPDGNVTLCPYMEPIGNLRRAGLKNIWFSQQAKTAKEKILRCRENCHHIINCWYEEEL